MIIEISTVLLAGISAFSEKNIKLPTIALSKLTCIPEPCNQAMEKKLYVPP